MRIIGHWLAWQYWTALARFYKWLLNDKEIKMGNDYNGYKNYATWRVQLELVDDEVRNMLDNDPKYFDGKDKFDLARDLQAVVEELLENSMDGAQHYNMQELTLSYAMAFLADVDWVELAEHALENVKEYTEA